MFGILWNWGVARVNVATLKGVAFGISRAITKRLDLTSGSRLGFRLRPHNRRDPKPCRDRQTGNQEKCASRDAYSEEHVAIDRAHALCADEDSLQLGRLRLRRDRRGSLTKLASWRCLKFCASPPLVLSVASRQPDTSSQQSFKEMSVQKSSKRVRHASLELCSLGLFDQNPRRTKMKKN